MDFGSALRHAEGGARVSRHGWNGKGQWVCYSPGATLSDPFKFWGSATKDWAIGKIARDGHAVIRPYLILKTAQDDLQIGWLASQSDMLAKDWFVVEYDAGTVADGG